jgi:hypothetical protein
MVKSIDDLLTGVGITRDKNLKEVPGVVETIRNNRKAVVLNELQKRLGTADWYKMREEMRRLKKKQKLATGPKMQVFEDEDLTGVEDGDSDMTMETVRGTNRYVVSSDVFEIDPTLKILSVAWTKLSVALDADFMPWPNATHKKGEKDLGAYYPRIDVVSSETNKRASFFLQSINQNQWKFAPSKGTLMPNSHPQLRGWAIWINKDA